jgi:hypothetical protein
MLLTKERLLGTLCKVPRRLWRGQHWLEDKKRSERSPKTIWSHHVHKWDHSETALVVMDFRASLSGFHTACSFVSPLETNYWTRDIYVYLTQYFIVRLRVRRFSLTLCCEHLATHPHVICFVSSVCCGGTNTDDTHRHIITFISRFWLT